MPGVVTGSQVTLPADGGTYTLYYLFPMTEQESTLSLVRRALVTAGVLLVLLVGGVTWMVTRQVVTPVRLARRVAERLASGRLEERMHVRGDDDIARLGQSFNQMAASLQKQIRQLEELSRVQRRFVSDVSHELRTPLTTVRMAGDVLHDARSRFDPPTARAAELLQNELDRFELLLSDLLEISRFDAGAAVLDLEDVNLVDLAHRVVDSTRPLAERRGIRVVVRQVAATGDTSGNGVTRPCVAEADTRRVERVVRNLVTNAIDYADSDDVVVLVAAETGRHGARRARPRGRAEAGRGGDGLQPLLARRPGAGPDQRRHRPGAVDLARGRPAARRLAAGVGGAGPGRPVPADAAPGRGRADRRQPAAAGAGGRERPDGPPPVDSGDVVSRLRLLLVALLAAVSLDLGAAACVRLPQGGPVRSVAAQDDAGDESLLRLHAARPAARARSGCRSWTTS